MFQAPGCWGSADVLFSMRVRLKGDDDHDQPSVLEFEAPVLVGSSRNSSTHFWFPESFSVLADGTIVGPVRTTDDGPVSEPLPNKPFLPGCHAGTGGGTGCVALRLSTDSGQTFGWVSNDTSTFPTALQVGVGDHSWGGVRNAHGEYILLSSPTTLKFNSTCSHSPFEPCDGSRCILFTNPGFVRRVAGSNRLVWSATPRNLTFCGLPWHIGCGDGRTAGNNTAGCVADLFRAMGGVAIDERTGQMYMAISPLDDLVAKGGNSGLAVATSSDGLSWRWLSWVVQPHELPKRYLYEKLAVGAAEQTLGILPGGRMMVVARQCSCANVQPPQVGNPFKCVGNHSTSCEYAVSYSSDGRKWSPLGTLTHAGSVDPTIVRFGDRTLLSGGRRGAFVWELSATGHVQAGHNIRSLHNAAVERSHLPPKWKFTQRNQTFPHPYDDGESTSYMSMLRLSDNEGLIVYDQLANNWVGPVAGHNEYPRADDHVYAMRFRLLKSLK